MTNTSTIARPAHSSRRTVDITRNRNYLVIVAQNTSYSQVGQIITPTGVNEVKIAIKMRVTYQILRLN